MQAEFACPNCGHLWHIGMRCSATCECTPEAAHAILPPGHCHAGRDGDCEWRQCPQAVEYRSWCPLARVYLFDER